MTNSEEPSAPDDLSSMNSSMKVSETFGNVNGTQHQRHHTNHLNHDYNHVNGDLKKSLGNESTVVVPGSGSSIPATTVLVSPSSCEHDNYTLHLPTSSQLNQHQLSGLPFSLICGEQLEHKSEIADGNLVLTNYRLFLQTKENTYNLPLGLIEQVECRDIFFLHLNCKDARYIRCTFPNNDAATEMMKRIQAAISSPKKLDESFAFAFRQKTKEDIGDEIKAHLGLELPPFPSPKERFHAEVKRMEFNTQGPWRISNENEDYELCSSYPTHIIVPCVLDKKKLEKAACFRSARRFPAVVWRHKGNGAVISRCSQPEVGWFGWRSAEDEELVQNIVMACADYGTEFQQKAQANYIVGNPINPEEFTSSVVPSCGSLSSIEVVPDPPNIKKLLILDARSYTTAVANRARGGGCECLEYYTNCEIQFMNLANIHSIRKSFINVRQLCSLPAEPNWFSQLESCKWLQHMSGLMKAAVTVATTIENEGRPVMVHCSDGWDRTPQIVALAEILLDPYYRSLEGFQIVVEREWLDFGHKFADRCGQGIGSEDSNERCPVFLQWLDCLHQLIEQFPTAFEFNSSFLIKLAQHTYSNLFGTFLCNTAKDREILGIETLTHSVWRFLRAPKNYDKFRNNLYASCDKVLWPSCEVRNLRVWSDVYLGYDNPAPFLTEVINPSQESSPAPSVTADCESSERMTSCKTLDKSKTRSISCENLHHPDHEDGLQRRKSETNLSASFLDGEMDEVDSRALPSTEKMLTAASKDIDEQNLSSSIVEHNGGLELKDCGSAMGSGETEDFSENEDTETNSEGKSESTVINLLKSIESSTDTLVAEAGVVQELYGIRNSVVGVNLKTDSLECSREDISCKTEHESLAENSETRIFIDNGIDASVNEYYALTTREKPQEILELTNGEKIVKSEVSQNDIEVDGSLSSQPCEVCASSSKLLEGNSLLHGGYSNGPTAVSSITNIVNSNNVHVMPSITGNSSGYDSKFSSYNTPMHSRTPSTGMPATPEESLYQIRNGYQEKCTSDVPPFPTCPGMHPSYDVDGLAPLRDEVQSRVNVIVSSCMGTIEHLHREVQMYRDALMKQIGHKCTRHILERQDDAASVADSLCSGEHQSVGHESHSSEVSFELVDEKDTRHALWYPDYAANNCMGCEAAFSRSRRKHHCRLCGKVFCWECSDHSVTIPSEQFFTPVRLCTTCYYRLNKHSAGQSPTRNGNAFMNGNGLSSMHSYHQDSPNYIQNGFHHRGSTSEYPVSSSPKGNSTIQRRLSEDIQIHRTPQLNPHTHSWSTNCKPSTENSFNGKKPSKQKSVDRTDSNQIVNDLVGDAKALIITNGNSLQ